jgi:hypothetical protein
MGALGTGFQRWGVLSMSGRCSGTKGDQDRLCSQKLHELPSDLAARPIAPAHRMNRNRQRGWCLFSRRRGSFRFGNQRSIFWRGGRRRRGARPEHRAHAAGLLGGAGFLTLLTQRAGTTMANAGGIQYAQRAIALWSTFLYKERMACRAAQRPIGLRRKRGTRKPMRKGGSCPLG